MQHIVHIAARKYLNGLVQEVRLLSHRCLYIRLYQVYAIGIAELDGYHVAACTRTQLQEMNLVVLVEDYLDVQFAEADIERRDNSL